MGNCNCDKIWFLKEILKIDLVKYNKTNDAIEIKYSLMDFQKISLEYLNRYKIETFFNQQSKRSTFDLTVIESH